MANSARDFLMGMDLRAYGHALLTQRGGWTLGELVGVFELPAAGAAGQPHALGVAGGEAGHHRGFPEAVEALRLRLARGAVAGGAAETIEAPAAAVLALVRLDPGAG